MKWRTYDAAWLAELVKKQYPNRLKVWQSLLDIKNYAPESKAYYYFIDPANANSEGSKWQFKENLMVKDEKLGELILDILEDDQVGGVEFYDLLK